MAAKMDFILGHIIFNRGLANQDELERCFALQEKTGFTRPLGQILVEQGIITQNQLEEVLKYQKEKLEKRDPHWHERRKDDTFGEIAINRGLVSREQVDRALKEQIQLEKQGMYTKIGTILIRMGALTPENVNQILIWQQSLTIACPICSYGIPRHKYKDQCPYCGAKLPLDSLPS